MSQRAEELCKLYPSTPSLMLARMLYAEAPHAFRDVEQARTRIRYYRGSQGDALRSRKTVDWKLGGPVACPPSATEPWTPVDLDWPARVLSLSDVHIPYHDQNALEAAVAWGRKWKPDTILLNGDWADFYAASHWDRDPRRRFVVDEIGPIVESLRWLRSKFRKQRIIYKLGNHEDRLDRYVRDKSPELWGLEGLQIHNVLKFEDLGIERVNDEPVMLGKLPALHGHELPRGLSNPVSAARGAFLRTFHSVLIAHHHQTGTYIPANMFGEEIATYSQGCICDLHPKFSRFPKWNWGFAAIDIAKDGNYDLSNLRISDRWEVRTA